MTDNRSINTGGGNYNENIEGPYIEYKLPDKPLSQIKAELSRKIANAKNAVNKLELEVKQLTNKLLSFLPLSERLDSRFVSESERIEDDFYWITVVAKYNLKLEEINRTRDELKLKEHELESQLTHLSNLGNQMKRLNFKEVADDVLSFVKRIRSWSKNIG